MQFLRIDNQTGTNKQAASGFETLPQSHYCHEHTHKLHTFFSGENLRGSTMYKSSGPTKEGREGAG